MGGREERKRARGRAHTNADKNAHTHKGAHKTHYVSLERENFRSFRRPDFVAARNFFSLSRLILGRVFLKRAITSPGQKIVIANIRK